MTSQNTAPARKYANFSEESSADVVNARMGAQIDPRFRQVMTAVVRHLHALVKEVELTQSEWETAIRFLTQTGHMCSDWRQEFILLSDVLGVSSLVDAVNHRSPSGATETTVLGPFYIVGAPQRENGANICLDGRGEPLVVRGHVRDVHGQPIAGAMLDIWQTNDDGFYDVQQKGVQPDFNLRARLSTEEDGSYGFRTVKPRFYPIPDDGPVGQLLAKLGRHPNRAAHIHFIVTAPGYRDLTTHVFAPDCTYLAEDAVFGVKDSLIASLGRIDDAGEANALGVAAPFWVIDWEFALVSLSP